jgi:transcriptional regulator with GAF, ATPase, and Fis domain
MGSFVPSSPALPQGHSSKDFNDDSDFIDTHQPIKRSESSAGILPFAQVKIHKLESWPDLVIYSDIVEETLNRIAFLENSVAPVLITGETGTGKELFARAVHYGSPRSSEPFVPINCAAISKELAESQLFGYRRGSFTGALNDHRGVIRSAGRGTLFLDEIGDMGIDLQPKLLRFLQGGEVHPVGEARPVKVDVRVIAATNRNLAEDVRSGIFRADLFYRLNVVHLHLPPLRDHPDKIQPLIAYYFAAYRKMANKPDLQLCQETAELLCRYDWPGNVRELCAELQRLALWAQAGQAITADSLSPQVRDYKMSKVSTPQLIGKILIDVNQSYAAAKDQLAREMITRALNRFDGNITRVAQELGMDRTGVSKAIKRLGIRP